MFELTGRPAEETTMADKEDCYYLSLKQAKKAEATNKILQSQIKSKAICQIINQERTANQGKKKSSLWNLLLTAKYSQT